MIYKFFVEYLKVRLVDKLTCFLVICKDTISRQSFSNPLELQASFAFSDRYAHTQ